MARTVGDQLTPRRLPVSPCVPFPRLTAGTAVLVKAAIGILLTGIFVWDLLTPLGQVPWLLYAPVLLLTLLLPYHWDALALAGLCTVLIVVDLYLSPPGGDPGLAIFNRSVGMVLIWTTAVSCVLYKRKQQSLYAHQSLIEQFVEHTPAAVAMLDRDMRYLLVSKRWLQDYKFTERDIIGRSHYEVFPELPDRWKEVHRRCLEGAVERCEEDSFLRRDGTVEWERWEVHPWWDAGGEIGGLIIFSEVITARKRTEEALRTSESRLRAILDNSPNPIFLKDLQGRYLLVNREFERALATSREGVLGRTDAEVFPAAQAAAFQANDRKVLAAGRALEFEEEAIQEDGLHTSIVHKFPLYDREGAPYAIGGIVTDITAHKQAEERIRAASEYNEQIISGAQEGIIVYDRELRYMVWNPFMQELTGLPPEAVLGKRGIDLFPFLRERGIDLLYKRALMGESVGPVDWYFTMPGNGRSGWVSTRYGPLRDAKGEIIGLIGTVRDITEQKRAQEGLRRSAEQLRALTIHLQSVREQERMRIARELHDEFGQVLTGLKMGLSSLGGRLSGLGGGKAAKPLLDRTHAMTKLVDESIATIRKLVAELRPAILDHLDLVAALEWQARDFQQRTGIGCKFRCALTGTGLDRDRTTAAFRIVQEALTNVARHAKATRVVVRLEEDGDELQLAVEDDGRGITDHEVSGLTSFGILGMRERVTLLDGQISFQGRPGSGTAVIVRFPKEAGA